MTTPVFSLVGLPQVGPVDEYEFNVDVSVAGDVSVAEDLTVTGAAKFKGHPWHDVTAYGAVGDGITDDTVSLQAALNAAAAAGGGTVFLPPDKTFRLNGIRTGTFAAILTIAGPIRVLGSESSVLKVADNYTAGGNYRLFAPASAIDTSDVMFEGFTIDGNAANNLVLGSSGDNIRHAYMIYIDRGQRITIRNMRFMNCPGRSAVVLGNNTNPVSCGSVIVINNRFENMGGAIAGNHLQNDHSSLYVQCDQGEISGNLLRNVAPFDYNTPAARAVTALEIHGSNTIVANNSVLNYSVLGNAVASIADSLNNAWVGNSGTNIAQSGISLWSFSGFRHKGLRIANNAIEFWEAIITGARGALVAQGNTDSNTTTELEDVTITDNYLYYDNLTEAADAFSGIQLVGVKGGRIANNIINGPAGSGILLLNHATRDLVIQDVTIENNLIKNVGHTISSRRYGIQVLNSAPNALWRNIYIDNNQIASNTFNTTLRGIRIEGGHIHDLVLGPDNSFRNVVNTANWIIFATATNHHNVGVVPRRHVIPSGTTPSAGLWVAGQDILIHNDVTNANLGRTVTTTGGATSALWVATTVYAVGDWIRTSGNKVLECAIAGTSSAVEPNPVTVGEIVTDGTVTWHYQASTLAVFSLKAFFPGELEIDGALNHDGTTIGFRGAAPQAMPAALVQTYSTADRTLAAYTTDTESVAYTGAADGEAKLTDLNALRTAYENLRAFTEDLAQFVNVLVDDMQAVGLEQ